VRTSFLNIFWKSGAARAAWSRLPVANLLFAPYGPLMIFKIYIFDYNLGSGGSRLPTLSLLLRVSRPSPLLNLRTATVLESITFLVLRCMNLSIYTALPCII